MKNKLVSIVLVTVLISTGLIMLTEVGASTATAPNEEWNRTFDGSGADAAFSVQQTLDGGYIVAGVREEADVWLIKTDSRGKKQWDKTFGEGDIFDVAESVQQTSDGGYIIAGWTQSYGGGSYHVWLIKTDSDGNKVWDKTFGGGASDVAKSVQQTSDGGYIIAGYTQSYGAGSDDAWLIKTDSDGNKVWDKTFGGDDRDWAESVQQTSDGGYIIAGGTQSYGAGKGDAWMIKTDSDGNKVWDKTFGGDDRDWAESVQQTSDGGYIIAGGTQSYGAGKGDAWLIKTDSDGNKVWDKTFGEDVWVEAYSVQQTSDGEYIIAGVGMGEVMWAPLLIKTDSKGNKQWDKIYGGQWEKGGVCSAGRAYSVQQTSDGGYIVTGCRMSSGGAEVWLMKLDGTGTGITSPTITTPDLEGIEDTVSPGVSAPDIEKPLEKSIPAFGSFGVMSVVFAVFLLMRRRA